MSTPTLDFYAYWNGQSLSELFTAIASMTATGDYRQILTIAVLFGFIAVLLGAALRSRGNDAITWSMTTFCIFMILFIPKVNLQILDVHSHHVRVVTGVPIGLGFPASAMSKLSWWLTSRFESAFQDVDAMQFSRFGLAFPQRALDAIYSTSAISPEIKEGIEHFATQCILPEMIDDPNKRYQAQTTPDLWRLILSPNWVNPARRTVIENKVLTCSEAANHLKELVETKELPNLEKILSAKLNVPADGYLNAELKKAIPGAEAVFLGMSQDLSFSLKHALLLNAIPKATQSIAHDNQSGSAMSMAIALSKAQGNLASEINYRTLSLMAESALPKIRNLLEFIILGTYPIVFIMVIAMGTKSLTIFRSWVTLLLSVSLWAPISALVNYLTVHVDSEPINRLIDAYGGVTLSSADLIREMGASSQAMAGSLMWAVPILAYALAKGSDMAATSLVNNVLTPAEGAARAQSATLAMGNVSVGNSAYGNANLNNVSGNKYDLSTGFVSDTAHTTSVPTGQFTTDDTGRVTSLRVAQADIGVASSGQWRQGESGTQSQGLLQSQSFAINKNETEGLASAYLETHSDGLSTKRDSTTSDSQQMANRRDNAENHYTGLQYAHGLNIEGSGQSSETMTWQSRAGAKGSLLRSVAENMGDVTNRSASNPESVGALNNDSTSSSLLTNVGNEVGNIPLSSAIMGLAGNVKNRPTTTSQQSALPVSAGFEGGLSVQSGVQRVDQVVERVGSSENIGQNNSTTNLTSAQKARSENTSQGVSSQETTGQVASLNKTKSVGNQSSWARGQNQTKAQNHTHNQEAGFGASYIDHAGILATTTAVYHGSALDALEALNQNPVAAQQLANQLQAKPVMSGPGNAQPQPPRFDQRSLTTEHIQNREAIAKGHEQRAPFVEAWTDASHTLSFPDKKPAENNLNKKVDAIQSTHDAYLEEEVGAAGLAKRSFGFGIGYDSPVEAFKRKADSMKTSQNQ